MVLEAAAKVLERQGHGGLTMRAVAAELGVQAPALYWYVKDKQALELALYDHLMSDLIFAPEGADWREDVRRMAQDLRRHFLSRRNVARLLPAGFFFAPRSMTLLDVALGVLLDAGLSPRDAGYAFVTAFAFVVNWSLGEAQVRERPLEQMPGLDADAKAMIASGAFPNFAVASASFTEPGDLDEQFLFGLNALIAGFERLIPTG
jgi:TetR/AcrR family tetracycline transcriptional repressor